MRRHPLVSSIPPRRALAPILGIAALALAVSSPRPASADDSDTAIPITEGLAIGPCGVSTRFAIHTDAIEEMVVRGTWKAPSAGDKVTLPDGTTKTWAVAKAKADGTFGDDVAMGGYLFARVTVPAEGVMLLAASGHAMVYVNGEPRAGDPYSYGFLRLPVLLKKGDNDFLFAVSRGPLRARLQVSPSATFLSDGDLTLPDCPEPTPGIPVPERYQVGPIGVVIVNASSSPRSNLLLRVHRRDRTSGGSTLDTPIGRIPALSVRKVVGRIPSLALGETESNEFSIDVSVLDGATVVSSLGLTIRPPASGAPRVRTFVSRIDGSVQSYAFRTSKKQPRGTVLTLHGASVEARNQAAAYTPKDELVIVAPTNRRPFGFDWEDWGRIDALEVLEDAQRVGIAPKGPVFLTGHSMGGHGTWHLGVTFPGLWSAIAPSAGWRSFTTYGGAPADSDAPIGKMLVRAASPSTTEALATNLAGIPVYALHGDADDNVPVGEMRAMLDTLKPFHKALKWHEQKGAGHWWDLADTPGVDCVDWKPIFDLFRERLGSTKVFVTDVDFVTFDPGVSAGRDWVWIDAQEHPFQRSRVHLHWDAATSTMTGSTENVLRMTIAWEELGAGYPERFVMRIDGGETRVTEPWHSGTTTFLQPAERRNGRWEYPNDVNSPLLRVAPALGRSFKAAFRHRFALVYATHGDRDENAWAIAKAKFDAETWYVRGNGSVDVVSDSEWSPPDTKWGDEQAPWNTILYGTREANSCWPTRLADSPVDVRIGHVRLGTREARGDDLACLFIRSTGSTFATQSDAVIAGTGPVGRRLCDRIPIFTSGVGIPDVMVVRADALSKGEKGLVAAGFFGPEWDVEHGDWAWREEEKPAGK